MKYFKFSHYEFFNDLYNEFYVQEQQIDYLTKGNTELKNKLIDELTTELQKIITNT